GVAPPRTSLLIASTIGATRRRCQPGRPSLVPARGAAAGVGTLAAMLRPGSCVRPAGGSPVRVSTGAPGSRPQSVVERWRAERGVEGLFGGSKSADRSIKRNLQPRQRDNEGAEPL